MTAADWDLAINLIALIGAAAFVFALVGIAGFALVRAIEIVLDRVFDVEEQSLWR